MREYNVVLFAASCDPAEKNKEFAESLDADYPILSDEGGEVASAYGIYNENGGYSRRVTFIIGQDGKILYVDDDVSPGSHGEDLVARLEELGIEKR